MKDNSLHSICKIHLTTATTTTTHACNHLSISKQHHKAWLCDMFSFENISISNAHDNPSYNIIIASA